MSFSDNIKEIRERSLMSQTAFAEVIGVSFSTVNRWEKGKTLPTYKAMKSIEDFCNENGIDFKDIVIAWKEEK